MFRLCAEPLDVPLVVLQFGDTLRIILAGTSEAEPPMAGRGTGDAGAITSRKKMLRSGITVDAARLGAGSASGSRTRHQRVDRGRGLAWMGSGVKTSSILGTSDLIVSSSPSNSFDHSSVVRHERWTRAVEGVGAATRAVRGSAPGRGSVAERDSVAARDSAAERDSLAARDSAVRAVFGPGRMVDSCSSMRLSAASSSFFGGALARADAEPAFAFPPAAASVSVSDALFSSAEAAALLSLRLLSLVDGAGFLSTCSGEASFAEAACADAVASFATARAGRGSSFAAAVCAGATASFADAACVGAAPSFAGDACAGAASSLLCCAASVTGARHIAMPAMTSRRAINGGLRSRAQTLRH